MFQTIVGLVFLGIIVALVVALLVTYNKQKKAKTVVNDLERALNIQKNEKVILESRAIVFDSEEEVEQAFTQKEALVEQSKNTVVQAEKKPTVAKKCSNESARISGGEANSHMITVNEVASFDAFESFGGSRSHDSYPSPSPSSKSSSYDSSDSDSGSYSSGGSSSYDSGSSSYDSGSSSYDSGGSW